MEPPLALEPPVDEDAPPVAGDEPPRAADGLFVPAVEEPPFPEPLPSSPPIVTLLPPHANDPKSSAAEEIRKDFHAVVAPMVP